jgi:hypothetical protein
MPALRPVKDGERPIVNIIGCTAVNMPSDLAEIRQAGGRNRRGMSGWYTCRQPPRRRPQTRRRAGQYSYKNMSRTQTAPHRAPIVESTTLFLRTLGALA